MSWWELTTNVLIGDEPADAMASTALIYKRSQGKSDASMDLNNYFYDFIFSLNNAYPKYVNPPESTYSIFKLIGNNDFSLVCDISKEKSDKEKLKIWTTCLKNVSIIYLENWDRKPNFSEILELFLFMMPAIIKHFNEIPENQAFEQLTCE